MKTKLYTCGTVLAVALVTFFFHRSHRGTSTPAVSNTEPSPTVQVRDQAPDPNEPKNARFSTYRWQVGDRASWQFGVSMRLASAPEKIAEGTETLVGGRLQLVVLQADSTQVTLAAALSDVRFAADGQRSRRYEELFNATPALLKVSPAGNLLEVSLPRHVAADDRNLLRLAYGWEFVARNAPNYQEGENAPDDAGSLFHATYQRSDGIHIDKARFIEPASAETDATQNVTASQFTGTVGKLWVSEMSGWEDTVMYLNGSVFNASRIVVSFQEETNSPPLTPGLFTLLSNPGFASSFSPRVDPLASSQSESVTQAVRREALAARWGAVPFDQVLHPMETLADGTMEELTKPMQDFEDWLAAHPDEGPEEVLQSLLMLPFDQTSLSGLLINGLAEADTTQAREALATILNADDVFPPTIAIQAALAAGDLGEKTPPALKETLARLMDSPLSDGSYPMSDTALFSYARLAKDDVEARDFLVQRVSPWLEATAVPNDTLKALSALSNAAAENPQLLARASEFARSTEADIRLATVEYLGSLPNTSPGRAILGELANDPDERVQAEVERNPKLAVRRDP